MTGGANSVDDDHVRRPRGEAENLEPEHDEIVCSRSVLVERLSTSMEVPPVVLDRDHRVGVAEIYAVAPSADHDRMLSCRLRKPGSDEEICDPLLRLAVTRLITRSAMLEDLAHHRALASTSSLEFDCDSLERTKRDDLPPQGLVDGAFHPSRFLDGREIAQRPSHRRDRQGPDSLVMWAGPNTELS
ncbi:MAG TPA: hypothetical protein VGN51_06870 [Acidimicrobiia bacterium]